MQHWSVDFVEHIRAVHFALAALATTLIILASPPDPRISRALTQATQIETLQRSWEEIRSGLFQRAIAKGHVPTSGTYEADFELGQTGRPPKVQLDVIGALGASATSAELVFFGGPRMDRAPQTIDEFRVWWNTVHDRKGLTVHMPDFRTSDNEKEPTCNARFRRLTSDSSDTFTLWDPTPCAIGKDRVMASYLDFAKTPGYLQSKVVGTLKYFSLWNNTGAGAALIANVANGPDNPNGSRSRYEIGVNIDLPMRTVTLDEAETQSIFFDDWTTGKSFADAFADLASVPAELKYIPIQSAILRIADLQPKREQEIEVVGLRVPVSELVKWGIALLITAQLYLLLHLNEGGRKLDAQSPGRDVAWIGLYGSQFATAVVLSTTCILPVIAFLALAWRSESSGSSTLHDPFLVRSNWMLTVALVATLLLAAWTGQRILRLRRSLHPDAAKGAT